MREAFEERAGILQFEAGHARELAETLAMLEVIRNCPLAVSALVALDVRLHGELMTILTTDLPRTRRHLRAIRAHVIAPADLAHAIPRIGIAAVLRPFG